MWADGRSILAAPTCTHNNCLPIKLKWPQLAVTLRHAIILNYDYFVTVTGQMQSLFLIMTPFHYCSHFNKKMLKIRCILIKFLINSTLGPKPDYFVLFV